MKDPRGQPPTIMFYLFREYSGRYLLQPMGLKALTGDP